MELVTDLEEMQDLFGEIDLKAIIFDFDGTLVDSEPVWNTTFFDLFKDRYGISVSQEILWGNTGRGVDLSTKAISDKYELNLSDFEFEKIAHELHSEMERKILSNLPLREGVVETMDWADENNISMAICTASTSEMIDRYFKNQLLRERFSHVFSTAVSTLEKRKPYPYPYLETMKLLGVDGHQTLVIEDSPSGIKSAVAAGTKTIAIHNPILEAKVAEARPIFQVKGFPQILELLASLQR